MTLTEIINGLDCCKAGACRKCPYYGCEACVEVLIEDAAEMLRIQRNDIEIFRQYIAQGKNIISRSEGI